VAELSPVAQAVLDAIQDALDATAELTPRNGSVAAAALRAAADQLHHDPKQSHQIGGIIASRSQLLAIAAELDDTPKQSQ
jgi:hypothetical protein